VVDSIHHWPYGEPGYAYRSFTYLIRQTQSSIEGTEWLSVVDEVSSTSEDKPNPVAVNWFSIPVLTPPGNIQKDPSIYKYLGSVHPDRISIIDNMTQDLSESD